MSEIIKLEEKRAELVGKLDALHEKAGVVKGSDGKERPNFNESQYAEYRGLVKELDEVVPQIKDYQRGEDYRLPEITDEPRGKAVNRLELGDSPESKTMLESVLSIEGGVKKNSDYQIKFDPRASVGYKATMTTAAGFAPAVRRDNVVIPVASIRPRLLDFMRVIPWDRDAYYFMRGATRTNAAAPKAQAAAADEATLTFTQVTVPIEKIPVYLPVSDEQLDDESGIRAIIEDELMLMVRQVLTTQVISGNGTTPNLRGLLNLSGVQTQAKGSDNVFDAIRKAMTKSMVANSGNGGSASPDLLVLHPNDWQDLILERDANGRYLMGDPGQPGLRTVWGLNVVQEESATENTGIVLDSNMVPLVLRQSAEIAVSDSHSDYFVKGIQAIKCTLRGALASHRDASVVTVTGI